MTGGWLSELNRLDDGWKNLGDNFRAVDLRELKTRACCWEGLVLLNYVSTAFPDPAWTVFTVERHYFRRVKTDRDTVLQPLAEGDLLHLGDEVEVHLIIRSKAPAEYVHLRDPRPAGLEPGLATSGYRYDLGLIRYEETATAAPTSSSKTCRKANTPSNTASAPTSPAPSAPARPPCSRCTPRNSPPIRQGRWYGWGSEARRPGCAREVASSTVFSKNDVHASTRT